MQPDTVTEMFCCIACTTDTIEALENLSLSLCFGPVASPWYYTYPRGTMQNLSTDLHAGGKEAMPTNHLCWNNIHQYSLLSLLQA